MENQVAVFEEFPWGDVVEVVPYEKVDTITSGGLFNIVAFVMVAIVLYFILRKVDFN